MFSIPSRRTRPILSSPCDNVVVTNHIGWYSEESMRDLQRLAAEEVVRILRGESPRHWLNPW
jgi:D-3-phosphoglycerate dehydrogenase